MSWQQLHIYIDRDTEQQFEQALLDLGAISVTLSDGSDEAILEPGVGETPLWRQLKLSALFPADINTDTILLQLCARTGDSLPTWRWETLDDEAWTTRWQTDFKPLQCGGKLWICPSWCQPPEASAVNLQLDPGLALAPALTPLPSSACSGWTAWRYRAKLLLITAAVPGFWPSPACCWEPTTQPPWTTTPRRFRQARTTPNATLLKPGP